MEVLQAHGRRIRPSVLGRAGPAIVAMGVSAAKGDQSFMASRASGEMLEGRGKQRCGDVVGQLIRLHADAIPPRDV